MKPETAHRINEIYHNAESEFPDKSTEFLLEFTAERCRIQRIMMDCSSADVANALIATGEYK